MDEYGKYIRDWKAERRRAWEKAHRRNNLPRGEASREEVHRHFELEQAADEILRQANRRKET